MKPIILIMALITFAGVIVVKAKEAKAANILNIPQMGITSFTGGQPLNGEGSVSPFTFTSVYPTDRSRAIYNSLRSKDPGGKTIITPGYLRLEQSLQGTFTNILFNVLVNQGTSNVTERRLNITDTFVMTHIGLYLIKAGVTIAATDAEKAAAKLRANNNALVFTTAGEAAALEGIYNGSLRIVINSKVWMEAMDNRRFYRVETAQKGVGPAVITTDDGWPSPNYGLAELTPAIELNGAGKNEISVTLPTSSTTSGTASQNFICFYARGFLCQNKAVLN